MWPTPAPKERLDIVKRSRSKRTRMNVRQEQALADWLTHVAHSFSIVADIFEEIARGTTITTEQAADFAQTSRTMESHARVLLTLMTIDYPAARM